MKNMITIPQQELVVVTELKTDQQNPNRMTPQQHERLATSIERYGFIVPIITNKDLLIADGEQRWTVAKSLGMTQVPVIRLPVEDVDRRLLRQVLNKLKGEHDSLLDADEFEKIIAMGKEDDLKYLLELDDVKLAMLRNTEDFDAVKEWLGMPEYNSEDLLGRTIVVHFEKEQDIREFATLIGQNITEKTRYIWFPYKSWESSKDLRYTSET